MTIRQSRVCLCIGVVSALPCEANAESVPSVYVSGENNDSDMNTCSLSYSSAVAAAEAAFRFNRIQISSRDDYISDKALNYYLSISALPISRGPSREFTGTCSISLIAQLKTFTKTYNPVTRTIRWAEVQYCADGASLIMDKLKGQESLEENIRQEVNACVSKYEKAQVVAAKN